MSVPPRRPLRALTVWQPWAGLLATGVKLVENRTWRPRDGELRVGEAVAIHAGARYDEDSWDVVVDLRRELKPLGRWTKQREAPWPLTSKRPRKNHDAEPDPAETPYGAILGIAVLDEVRDAPRTLTDARGETYLDPWWGGPVGWYLRDPVPIAPVYCRGAQGLWTVPDLVLPTLRTLYRAALNAPTPPPVETP